MAADNPKHIRAQKEGKVPMERIPWRALAPVARVMAGGSEKYGVRNWHIDKILASTYVGAIARHGFLEWAQGTDVDKDSGEHPLAHVAACCLIVLDAIEQGTLIDDRHRAESINALAYADKSGDNGKGTPGCATPAEVGMQRDPIIMYTPPKVVEGCNCPWCEKARIANG